jgi:tetratricopeptide (TPR) repeat protein
VGLLVAFLFGSLPARAAESDKAIARAHYETATRLYEVREYAEALKEYKAAYVAKPDPAFLFNIGQCYRKLDKNAEALDFFQQFLKKAPADDPVRPQVEERIRNIKSGLGPDRDPFDRSRAPQPAAAEPAPPPPSAPAQWPAPSPAPAAAPAPAGPAWQEPLPVTPAALPPAGVEVTAPAPAREAPAASSPSRWWIWAGIAAVVVAGAATAMVLVSRGGGTEIPASTLGSRTVSP